MEPMLSFDDNFANITTERAAGLKTSYMKLLNNQQQSVFSPSIKEKQKRELTGGHDFARDHKSVDSGNLLLQALGNKEK